ncbi:MAG: TonB-dependent receptor [Candidatus Aminicenantes bacterium]|nr:TonB-dependent receptor [Candidatus Aminicenantes bacterium]
MQNVRLIKSFFSFLLVFTLVIGSPSLFSQDTSKQAQKKKQTKVEKKAEEKKKQEKITAETVIHNEITVTATRPEVSVFDAPKPVTVIGETKLQQRAPNNISELLPETPGTDMVGVGANQSRPVIRGLRGQRILLLSDGIRLSNSRRTQAFGEIPGLVDVSGMERVEIVRGPASVLYGSEAIGGVINMISSFPEFLADKTHVSGNLGYRYSSADSQNKGFLNFNGNVNNFRFMLSGSYRDSKDYTAPAGDFGDITLSDSTQVTDTGVKDYNLNFFAGYRFLESNDISIRYENYDARDAGFGYVDPALYSPGDPVIKMTYPEQSLKKFSLKFENRAFNFVLADRISFVGYSMTNARSFSTNIDIEFFPGAGITINSSNYTDIQTLGSRLELTKVLFQKHVVTYGFEFYQDSSANTDENTQTMYGMGPPMVSVDNIPKVPNALYQSYGVFVQDNISLFPRSTLILGMRYQSIHAKTKATEGVTDPIFNSQDGTLVGAANFIYGIIEDLNAFVSVGRGFRSPNLPERFYNGVTPDGAGFQVRNTDLTAETSLNFDVGLRYRLGNFYVETTYFNNMIYDGIQIVDTGEMLGRMPIWQNVNFDKLKLRGAEALAQFSFDFGLSFLTSFSTMKSENLANPELMNADTYGSRINFNVRYAVPSQLFWVEYHVRHNGEQKYVDLGDNPIGSVIPGFTVHYLRGGFTLLKNTPFPQYIGIIVGNLSNALYSEFSNASFFRPAPKRHVVVTWTARF